MSRPRLVRQRAPASGFSLLELLVVVVIVGILASMFTLSIGLTRGDRAVEQEIDRMQALLEVASEDAVLQGRELGIRFDREGYEFLGQDPDLGNWNLLYGDAVLRRRELDPDLRLALEIEGRDIDLEAPEERAQPEPEADEEDADEDSESTQGGLLPQIFIFSSGDIGPPFMVRLRRDFGDLTMLLEVKADGSMEVTRENF
ncbi:MAG: type II secretion system minor pseudopilin GspH [Gammaproteobacteria bacterium]|nr:type II secretion system minor pseudopilin GspH [Gammaproteobacteria bacterium]